MGLFQILKTGYDVYQTVKPAVKVVNEGLKIANTTIETNNMIMKTMNQQSMKDNINSEMRRHFYKFKHQMPNDIRSKFENRIFNESLIEVETTKSIAKTMIRGFL